MPAADRRASFKTVFVFGRTRVVGPGYDHRDPFPAIEIIGQPEIHLGGPIYHFITQDLPVGLFMSALKVPE